MTRKNRPMFIPTMLDGGPTLIFIAMTAPGNSDGSDGARGLFRLPVIEIHGQPVPVVQGHFRLLHVNDTVGAILRATGFDQVFPA